VKDTALAHSVSGNPRVASDHTQRFMLDPVVAAATACDAKRVVALGAARGVPVRIGSRSSDPPFDWDDPETWAGALYRVESVYVSYYPDRAVPGAIGAVRSFADLAVQAGVRRLVLLSGR
jgi:hypothetical protein